MRQRAHQRAQAADSAGFSFGREKRQPEIVLGEIRSWNARQSVARRADDEIDGAGFFQPCDERRGIAKRVGSRDRVIEKEAAVIEAADVDADGAGIDTNDTRPGE